MSADIERLEPPNDPVAFESLCLELCRDIWQGNGQKNGRRGQPQAGVDIFGQHRGQWVGVQCKQKDGLLRRMATVNELEDEVAAARQFRPPLSKFVLATTGPRDVRLQERARELTEQHNRLALFEVEVWSWDELWSEIYQRPQLLERIGATYWPRLWSFVTSHERHRPCRIFTSKLPTVDLTLIGRAKQLAVLDRAWANPSINFIQVIAAAGTGKTALIDKWFRRHLGEASIFGWSFFTQANSPNQQTSSDSFFAEILSWMQIEIAPTASVYAKAEAVATRLRAERILLLLDGVEPLQDATGNVRDMALKALLQEVSTANRGLLICTTRFRMDIPDDPPRTFSMELDNLTPKQGARYLRKLGVKGMDHELQNASREYWNHALALTLLGTYLVDFCDADIRRRIEIPALMDENLKEAAHARRLFAAYARMFADKPEFDILAALGYFDRPAEPAALKLVLPPLEDRQYRAALKRLHNSRLILCKDPTHDIDCHPLCREHFARESTRDGHARLFDYYKGQAAHRPCSLEEMTPLFHAVYHGCRAERHQGALFEVYYERILHGEEFYLWKKLGAFGTDLSLLVNFFQTPWTHPVGTLSLVGQASVFAAAGIALRALGRLSDAVEPMHAAAEAFQQLEDWDSTAQAYINFSELHLTLGNIGEAQSAAQQAVDFAEQSTEWNRKVVSRTVLAYVLTQADDTAEALRLFAEAERIQAESQPDSLILNSVRGYRYCDLLLDRGQSEDVIRRASESLVLAEQNRHLLAIGLSHLSLGRALPGGSTDALRHLDLAIDSLHDAGQLDDLPRALLARNTDRDLEEAFLIASRGGMRLHLADYHLARADRALGGHDRNQARAHLEKAERLINETGYKRRAGALEELCSIVGE